MLFIIILTLISSICGDNTQPLFPSSSSLCKNNTSSALCTQPIVLRGQSHIGIPSSCFKRADSGPCTQDIVRVYFDRQTFTCKPFSYSGCGGNENRFVSVKNCYKLCHPFYRSRFLTLGVDQGKDPGDALNAGDGGKDDDDDKDDDKEGKEDKEDKQDSDKSTTPSGEEGGKTGQGGSTEKGGGEDKEDKEDKDEDTETTESNEEQGKEDPWNQGMVYFQAPDGNQIELQPAIQQQTINQLRNYGMAGPEQRAYQQPLPGSPGWRRAPISRSGAPSALSNIQHEKYQPMGQYFMTRDGVRETPVGGQKVLFTRR